jgi:hypothetical protein
VPASQDWELLFEKAKANEPIVVKAKTYRKSWPTFSKPVLVLCNDGKEYVVKGRQVGRAVFNDQVVGRLGNTLGIPVGDVTLVDVSDEFIAMNESDTKHIDSGLAHGCKFVPMCTERMGIQHTSETANRERYARLAVFYGWFFVKHDHQFFFTDSAPFLVHSFDHGHFFPEGPSWTAASLAGANNPSPDALIVRECGLKAHEIDVARSLLSAVTPDVIAAAIAAVPAAWGEVTDSERVALAVYLWERCAHLCA